MTVAFSKFKIVSSVLTFKIFLKVVFFFFFTVLIVVKYT